MTQAGGFFKLFCENGAPNDRVRHGFETIVSSANAHYLNGSVYSGMILEYHGKQSVEGERNGLPDPGFPQETPQRGAPSGAIR